MSDRLYFLTGLPRSGTTLMMNLLGQNPAHHVTPTSGLIHLMLAVIDRWPHCQEFKCQGLQHARPLVESALRGMFHGYFQQPLDSGRAVFDKSRGWLQYVEVLETFLPPPVKMITLVRDPRSVVASFEKMHRRRGIDYRQPQVDDPELYQTVAGRARFALQSDQVTGRSFLRLRDALARCPDRLLIVPYERFTADPLETMRALHDWLDLPAFDYDPAHVEQITHEDDNHLGLDFHRIRSRIEPQDAAPWEAVLSAALANEIASTHADLVRLAAGPVIAGNEMA